MAAQAPPVVYGPKTLEDEYKEKVAVLDYCHDKTKELQRKLLHLEGNKLQRPSIPSTHAQVSHSLTRPAPSLPCTPLQPSHLFTQPPPPPFSFRFAPLPPMLPSFPPSSRHSIPPTTCSWSCPREKQNLCRQLEDAAQKERALICHIMQLKHECQELVGSCRGMSADIKNLQATLNEREASLSNVREELVSNQREMEDLRNGLITAEMNGKAAAVTEFQNSLGNVVQKLSAIYGVNITPRATPAATLTNLVEMLSERATRDRSTLNSLVKRMNRTANPFLIKMGESLKKSTTEQHTLPPPPPPPVLPQCSSRSITTEKVNPFSNNMFKRKALFARGKNQVSRSPNQKSARPSVAKVSSTVTLVTLDDSSEDELNVC